VFVQDVADGSDAGVEHAGRVLDGALVLADELVEAGDVEVIRVGSGQVETAQQRGGRLPGDRLVVDVVLGEEVPCFSSQCIGEFGGLEAREVGGLLPELRFGEVLVAGEGIGGEAADALEEQAPDDLFAGSSADRRAGVAADL
jgi:hypothetical protein